MMSVPWPTNVTVTIWSVHQILVQNVALDSNALVLEEGEHIISQGHFLYRRTLENKSNYYIGHCQILYFI